MGASARTAKGASATRTMQEEVVEEASLLKTVKDSNATKTMLDLVVDVEVEVEVLLRTVEGPNATKTTLLVVLVVLVDSHSHPPTSTTRFKTAKEASATRTTLEEDLEDFHSGNS